MSNNTATESQQKETAITCVMLSAKKNSIQHIAAVCCYMV